MDQQKSILITGCSSGIGYDAAETLKQRGYRVFASARKQADVDNLNAEGFEGILLDMTQAKSMENALTEILERTQGRLDALFNNAGFMQVGAIEDIAMEFIYEQFETNFFGPIRLTKLVLPIMQQQGSGRIIQNSSLLGLITVPYYGIYNASKFALEGFSNTLRQELRNTAIHVSILNPGPVKTQLRNNAYTLYQNSISKNANNRYKEGYQQLEKNYFNKPTGKLDASPDVVIKQLIHALESPHPKAHYYIGLPAKMMAFFRRILSDNMLDWLIARSQ